MTISDTKHYKAMNNSHFVSVLANKVIAVFALIAFMTDTHLRIVLVGWSSMVCLHHTVDELLVIQPYQPDPVLP